MNFFLNKLKKKKLGEIVVSTLIMSESWVLKKSYNEDEIHSSLYTIEKKNKIIWLSFVKITNQPRIQLLKKLEKR